MGGLKYGGFFVKERTAPEGFCLDENAYYFEIVEDGETVIVENEAGVGFIDTAQVGSLKIVKTSPSMSRVRMAMTRCSPPILRAKSSLKGCVWASM